MSKSVATKAISEISKIQMMLIFSFALVCSIDIAVLLFVLAAIVFIFFWKKLPHLVAGINTFATKAVSPKSFPV